MVIHLSCRRREQQDGLTRVRGRRDNEVVALSSNIENTSCLIEAKIKSQCSRIVLLAQRAYPAAQHNSMARSPTTCTGSETGIGSAVGDAIVAVIILFLKALPTINSNTSPQHRRLLEMLHGKCAVEDDAIIFMA